MATRRIENEESYQRSLGWLVEKSKELSDPLMNAEEKNKLMRNYDIVSDEVMRFRRAELARKFPDLRRVYEIIGYEVADVPEDDNQKQPPDEQNVEQIPSEDVGNGIGGSEAPGPETAAEEPANTQPEETAVNLSDWLDDE